MLLATGLLVEFAELLQIISWIVVPVLMIVVIVTVGAHYHARKKRSLAIDNGSLDSLLASPVDSHEMPDEKGAYLLFDHSGLIRQYRNKLTYNHAKYSALKQDFEKLALKYNKAVNASSSPLKNTKNNDMKNNNEELQEIIDRLTEEYNNEKIILQERMQALDRSYKNLETENESLLEQLNMQTATEGEKEIIVNRWREENSSLKIQLKEQQFLRDMLEEKTGQVNFLQAQAEQRIKNYHQAEQQRADVRDELLQLKQSQQRELDQLNHELARRKQVIDALQNGFDDKDTQLEEKQQLLVSKEDHITYLENRYNELREQNELLNASLADSHDRNIALQQQLEDEHTRLTSTEHKLIANKQLLQRLYKEFSSCIEEEQAERPVVTLRPYINQVQEG